MIYEKGDRFFRTFNWQFFEKGYYQTKTLAFFKTVSDASGAFSFSQIPSDKGADLLTNVPGLTRTRLGEIFDKPENEWQNLAVVVTSSASVIIHINHETYPKPMVSLRSKTTPPMFESHKPSPEENPFVLEGLGAGDYKFSLATSEGGYKIREREDVTLEEGETAEIEWGFDAAFQISGTALVNEAPAAGHSLVLALKEDHTWQIAAAGDEGSFIFENVKAGSYSLLLVGKGETRLTSMVNTHPDQQNIEVDNADVSGVYRFRKMGAVFGSLKVNRWRNIYLRGAYDGKSYRRTLEVSGIGPFRFMSIPPGTYSLHGSLDMGGDDLLVPDFVVPEDGSDVDLGELGEEGVGTLELHYSNPELLKDCYKQIQFYRGNQSGAPALPLDPDIKRSDFERKSPHVMTNLPVGVYTLRVRVFNCAVLTDPILQVVEIQEDETTEAHFNLSTTTLFRFQTEKDKPGYTSVRLYNQEGEIVLNKVSADTFKTSLANVRTHFTARVGIIQGVGEGKWSLEITSAAGKTVTKEIDLIMGEAQSEIINVDP